MARKRRNRRRSQAAKLKRQYANRSKLTEDTLRDEQYRQRQREYMEVIQQKQKNAAETTVFITQVLNLNDPTNLEGLREFLQRNYGPLAFCRIHHHHKSSRRKPPFPPALVRFERAADAAKLFGGISLLRVNKSAEIRCTVGHRGSIKAQPYRHVEDIVQDEMSGSIVSVSLQGVSLGHWFPAEDTQLTSDVAGDWLGVECIDESNTGKMSFPAIDAVFSQMGLGKRNSEEDLVKDFVMPTLKIDLAKRVVSLVYTDLLLSQTMSFRFKQLQSPICLCEDDDTTVSIVFSLKVPPKIERTEFLVSEGKSERCTSWANFSTKTIGACLGYKFALSKEEVRAIQQHERYRQLKSFGVIDIDQTQYISSKVIGWKYKDSWEHALTTRIQNFRLRKCLVTALERL